MKHTNLVEKYNLKGEEKTMKDLETKLVKFLVANTYDTSILLAYTDLIANGDVSKGEN